MHVAGRRLKVGALLAGLLLLLVASDTEAAGKRRADLVAGAVSGAPARLAPGGAVEVRAKVTNQGRRRARASRGGLYLSKDAKLGGTDARLAGIRIPALKPRGSRKVRARGVLPANATTGAYRLLLCADVKRKVRESSERNNCRAAALEVTTGPLVPGPPTPPVVGPVATPTAAPTASPTPEPSATETPTAGPTPTVTVTPTPTPSDVDPDAPVDLATATQFLVDAQGAAPGVIDPRRIAVIRGTVRDDQGDPLAGVQVSALGHEELGQAETDANGDYSLVINGGGASVVDYAKPGLLPAQRRIVSPWRDYVVMDDVVLLALDTAATAIDPDSQAPFQVARATAQTDEDGTRRATLLFPEGAGARTEAGPLTGPLTVRATEYTSTGVDAMPGTLSAANGYTYAVELTIDEAAGEPVTFDKPVIEYTENFVSAPVGAVVPSASYDREQGRWVGERNGRVIEVVSEADGKAGVDLDGDGIADPAGLGITDAERATLADLYNPGDELWRMPVSHFSPWDFNFPFGPPAGAQKPNLDNGGDPEPPPETSCRAKGSIIDCDHQALGEEIGLTGTPLRLVYRSDRAPGDVAADEVRVRVTGGVLPPGLQGIRLRVDIAGRRYERSWTKPDAIPTNFPPIAPDISETIRWDGKDAFGRPVAGRPTARISLVYVYPFVYYATQDELDSSWGQVGDTTNPFAGRGKCTSFSIVRDDAFKLSCGVQIETRRGEPVGGGRAPNAGLGGWTLSAHHHYDPLGQQLIRGDGENVGSEAAGPVTKVLAGGGSTAFPAAEGGPALQADLGQVEHMDVAADSTTYTASRYTPGGSTLIKVRRIDPDGTVHTIAGGDVSGDPDCDGGDARTAKLGLVNAISAGADGDVYLALRKLNDSNLSYLCVIRDGHLIRLAGLGTYGPSGDDGPALDARVSAPSDVRLGPDGLVYWAEQQTSVAFGDFRGRVRRIDADGKARTIAGNGTDAGPDEDLGDGEPALEHTLTFPGHLGFDEDGNLYIPQQTRHIVDRVDRNGIITRFAGNRGTGAIGWGGLATEVDIGDPVAVAVGPDGIARVLVENGGFPSGHVLQVGPEGRVEPLVGRLCAGPGMPPAPVRDGQPAARVCPPTTRELSVSGDGRPILAYTPGRIFTTGSPLPEFGDAEQTVPSTSGGALYVFDDQGHHLRTVDTLTGVSLWRFEYDASWRLVRAIDEHDQVTTIERDGDGAPHAVVAPGGQRTALELDGDGQLAAVETPLGARTEMDYAAGGLLTTYDPPATAPSTFTYDASGRLKTDAGPDGTATLTRSDDGTTVDTKLTSAAGYETTVRRTFTGEGAYKRTVIGPTGAEATIEVGIDGVAKTTAADGTETTLNRGPDPRFGMRAPVTSRATLKLPSGLTRTEDHTRTVSLSSPGNPLSVTYQRDDITSPSGNQSEEWEPSLRRLKTTAAGSVATTHLDDHGRMIDQQLDGLDTLTATYDDQGRPEHLARGTESLDVEWSAANNPTGYEDAAGHRLDAAYDADARPSSMSTGSAGATFGHDAAGRLGTVTPQGGTAYGLTYDGRGRLASFTPPGGAAVTYDYDADGRLLDGGFPGGLHVVGHYDGGGRLDGVTDPDGSASIAYAGSTGRPATLTRALTGGATATLAYGYDGTLVTSSEQSGASTGRFEYSYDTGLRATQVELTSGADTVTTARTFNAAGLQTGEGPYTLTRGGPIGQVSRIGDGTLALDLDYDGAGRVSGRKLVKGADTLASVAWTHGADGSVATRTTALGGAPHTDSFTYDSSARLTVLSRGGSEVERYAYDGRGNRTSRRVGAPAAQAATYDAQDRLLAAGATNYSFDAAGFLTGRGADSFEYTRLGELRRAIVGGHTVTYAYDAGGRRVARTDGGDTTEYLYGEPDQPARVTAVRAPDGALTVLRYDREGYLHALDVGADRYRVLTDQAGSPIAVADDAGTLVKTIAYDAWGGVTDDSAPAFELPVGYGGGLPDAVTGLVRFGFRDYDPATGRFTARDPLLYGGGQTGLYGYAGNDPIGHGDPTGLDETVAGQIKSYAADKAISKGLDSLATTNKSGTLAEGVAADTLRKTAETAIKKGEFSEALQGEVEGAAQQMGAHQEVRRLQEQAVKNAQGATKSGNALKKAAAAACDALVPGSARPQQPAAVPSPEKSTLDTIIDWFTPAPAPPPPPRDGPIPRPRTNPMIFNMGAGH